VPAITDEMLVAGARDAAHLEMLRALRFSAVIVMPLVARGRTLGALTVCMTDSGRHYDDADFALARELAQRAATAVDNAGLYREAERARRDAEAANEAKSQFLSTMSHELRTPLNALLGYTELMDAGIRGPVTDEQRADLARMRRSAKVLMALVTDVLNFARVEAGRVEFRVTEVSLATVLSQMEALVAPQMRAKRLEYLQESCDEALRVRADAERLQQVLTNLLTNAIKFTDEGGRITVRCDVSPADRAGLPRVVHVRVADTGRGIAAEQLGRIFEPFVQVDRHLTHDSQQGVGLGLAIARDLARNMGGDLSAESALGAGSVFTLTLPLAAD
jgi:signal transduction histidine kinase